MLLQITVKLTFLQSINIMIIILFRTPVVAKSPVWEFVGVQRSIDLGTMLSANAGENNKRSLNFESF
jgi:hypothetical protein